MKEVHNIHAFVDGELNSAEAREVRVWLSTDAAAQAELSAISNLKDFLKNNSSRHSTHEGWSDECWKACVKRLNELDNSKKVESFVGKYAWAMCAALFVLVIGGRFAVSDVRGSTVSAADLGLFHSSRQAPSPQLQKLFDQIMAQSRANRSGVRVLSRQSGILKDSPVDRLVIEDEQGALTYYRIQNVLNVEDASEVPSASGISGGIIPGADESAQPRLNYVIWIEGNLTNVLIGPRSINDLGQAAIHLGLKTSLN